MGRCHIDVLIKKKKIDATWKGATTLKIVPAKNKRDWMITFENLEDKKNKILYIFLSPKGRYIAANFKGES